MYTIAKKILACLMAGILATTSLAGCGKNIREANDFVTNDGYNTAPDSTDTANNEGIRKENIKVGVLYISDPADGSGYSFVHDLGILGMQSNLGLSDGQIERRIVPEDDIAGTKAAIEDFISNGCNIIFSTSWGYMKTTAKMAEKYPDIYFSHCTGYMSNGKNFNNYFGRIYQIRYLSGIVAGMNTTSGKIGYVAAQDSSNSEVTGGIDAFAIGVASVNPDAKIYVAITNSWYDPEKEKNAAKKLLDMECDVMSQHCDTAYPMTLAQEYGAYGIGYNSDMSKEIPDTCLCSVIWNWSAYYTYAVISIMEGTWNGDNYFGGISDGLVQLTDLSSLCAEGTQEKVEEASSAILNGSNNVFDGELETNTGKITGSNGSTLDDTTITSGIDWYYKNVVIVK